jgi:hypothetical protein
MNVTFRKLRHKIYQPFRRWVVWPIENSKPYRAFFDRVLAPAKKSFRQSAGRLLAKAGLVRRCVVVGLDGGLGNQMAEYSLGRRVALMCELPVYWDVSWFARRGMDIDNQYARRFELEEVFPGIRLRKAGRAFFFLYKTFFTPDEKQAADFGYVTSSPAPRYLDFSCVAHRDDIAAKEDFVFGLKLSAGEAALLARIEAEPCPVAVHVRRGDYVGKPFAITTPYYFREAARKITELTAPESPVFFVFSNGMDWCRENFAGFDGEFVFAGDGDNDRGAADMFLMSKCCHFINSNSTFSYWAALLSDRPAKKIIITPVTRGEFDKAGGAAAPTSGHIPVPVE